MRYSTFAFRLTPPDAAALHPQVSGALEEYTELLSRSRYPWLWQQTDRLSARKPDRPAPGRGRFMGAINLLLGLVLLPAGLTRSASSGFILMASMVGIGTGVGGLWRSFRPKRSTFDRAADTLLATAARGAGTVRFTPAGMTLPPDEPAQGSEAFVPCSAFEQIIETEDLLLFTWNGHILLLQKKDLEGDLASFFELLTRSAPQAGIARFAP